MNKYKSNLQGSCPVCGYGHLNWGDCENDGEYVNYCWECESCHSQGIESYRLVFEGHGIMSYRGEDLKFEMVNDYILPDCEAHDE